MKLITFTDCDGKMFGARADMISRIAPDPNRIGNTLLFLSTHAGEVAISVKGTFADTLIKTNQALRACMPSEIDYRDVADTIVNKISDGWGEAEDARVTEEIAAVLKKELEK